MPDQTSANIGDNSTSDFIPMNNQEAPVHVSEQSYLPVVVSSDVNPLSLQIVAPSIGDMVVPNPGVNPGTISQTTSTPVVIPTMIAESVIANKPGFFSRCFASIIGFFSYHSTYTALLLVMITSVLFFMFFSTPTTQKETFPVSLGSITQYVKVSGSVEASKEANLSFQTGGQVSFVGVNIGDVVTQGKVLATLSGGDAQAVVLQAEANLASAQALLSQLQQGARKEELALKEQVIINSRSTLEQSYYALPDTIQNVDAITADVIKNKFAALFVVNNSKYILSFSSCNQQLQTDIEQKRTNLEDMLAEFQKKSSVIGAISSTKSIDSTFESAYQVAIMTNDLVNSVSNLLLASCSISNSNLDVHRAVLSFIKTTMTALFSDITVKRSVLLAAKNAVNQATRDYDLTRAGTDPYKIKAQTALVSQARAQVATTRLGLSKTVLVAPFSGVVNSVGISEGEIVSVGAPVINIIATDSFEIEAKVPEIDIVKVKLGALVEVTLDAYGKSIVFPATITRINPGARMEGSVPIYTVIITFVGSDARIKQGMTANVQIIAESKSNIIVIPSRFVKVINGEKGTVTIFALGKEEVREVELGIRGADGLIEIKNGLLEGDNLVAPTTSARQSQKKTQ